MLSTKELKEAFDLVNNFRSIDIKSGIFNKFPLAHYKVPIVDGIHYGEYGKGIDKVKPSTLEYIIFNLHNIDEDMIIEAIIVLLYYWKIKKKQPKRMREVYSKISHHYTTINSSSLPTITINDEAVVYSISFNIGAIRVNKFGVTTDVNRFQKLISDISYKYPLVSIGNFKINQLVQFKTKVQAKIFENEAIKNLKKHKDYTKCKNLFNGYTEAYININ